MPSDEVVDPGLLDILRCPSSGLRLHIEGSELVSADGARRYPLFFGIPCLMLNSPTDATHQGYLSLLRENQECIEKREYPAKAAVVNFIQAMLVPTCGNLFRNSTLSGEVYPIPEFPLAPPGRKTLLEIGCNWGRWSIGGAKAGWKVVGMDIHLKSLICAQWLSRRLSPENQPWFVLGDARFMPFASQQFDRVFSYSVIQHFSRDDAQTIVAEARRVMKHGATSIIQMPNSAGIRSRMVRARRLGADVSEFDVRYYSIPELLALFERDVGKSTWHVDCFFGLNVHRADRNLVPYSKRWIIDVSEVFLQLSRQFPFIGKFGDSVFVTSTRSDDVSA